ncbi:uncharacterized protein CCR75_000640 [Bremia lactucae]|uniref:GPI-anchor transamidase n=1 Tax=Bremia lactucae TaxID=4779 RepID=A0A976FE03_BRELC|nr:hypothetical protein CCR75_000640 [Bremia lactucae]
MSRPNISVWSLILLALHAALGENYHRHTNNWAVIVDTSRFWSNYRHIANALSLYHSVKRLGIPDSQIILMLADQMPCNARNCFPGQVFNSRTQKINLYGKNVEVDYRGSEVSVANFITVLTGRHEPGTPASKKLDTDENSNIFDFEEMSSQDLADSIEEMHSNPERSYNEIFFMVDTCQAGTLSNALKSPKVVTIGSSKTGENSYAHHSDSELGLSVIDRFTFSTLDYLQRMKVGDSIRNGTLLDLFNFYDQKMLQSTPDYRTDNLGRSIDQVLITDFLGSILDVHLHYDSEAYPIEATVMETPIENAETITEHEVVVKQPLESTKPQSFNFSRQFLVSVAAALVGAILVTFKAV